MPFATALLWRLQGGQQAGDLRHEGESPRAQPASQGHLHLLSLLFFLSFTPTAAFELIKVEKKGAVGLITLNRPKALNALNGAIIKEINAGEGGSGRAAGTGL